MFFDRNEGLFFYAPMYVFAIPGLSALRRRAPASFWILLAIVVPYVLIAASHDQGGAGGWAPPSRYAIPLTPVLAIALSAWLGNPKKAPMRWTLTAMAAIASFLIGHGMLEERNYPYDRAAYLASGIIDPSAALGSILASQSGVSRGLYPALLVTGVVLFIYWERRRWPATPMRLAIALIGLVLITGFFAEAVRGRQAFVHPTTAGPIRLRADRPVTLELPDCGTGASRLQFRGTEPSHELLVRGAGFERTLTVPGTPPTSLPIPVRPALRIGGDGPQSIRIVRVHASKGQRPFEVEALCR